MEKLEDLIKTLPSDLREEVEDFVQFLLERRPKNIGENFTKIGLVH